MEEWFCCCALILFVISSIRWCGESAWGKFTEDINDNYKCVMIDSVSHTGSETSEEI